jgi:hypothetical protein
MPNRIIREGILSSDRVDQLDPPAEVFYRRLMSKVDDHGLFDGRASILRSSLYPLRVDRVREADISRWIAACEKAGLIALYQHDGKPYLQMLDTRWQTRSEAKYPLPSAGTRTTLQEHANSCAQVQTGEHLDVFGDGDEGGYADVSGAPPVAPRGGLFPIFWAAYPRKEGKAPAEKAFDKVKPSTTLLETMLQAIKAQAQSERWRKDGGQYIPMPATWLNQRRWEDQAQVEIPAGKPASVDANGETPEQKAERREAARRLIFGDKTTGDVIDA